MFVFVAVIVLFRCLIPCLLFCLFCFLSFFLFFSAFVSYGLYFFCNLFLALASSAFFFSPSPFYFVLIVSISILLSFILSYFPLLPLLYFPSFLPPSFSIVLPFSLPSSFFSPHLRSLIFSLSALPSSPSFIYLVLFSLSFYSLSPLPFF